MAWEQAGLLLEREARAPWALERQVRLVAGLLVLLGLALSHFWPVAIALAKLPWNRRSAPTCPLTETRP